jgi:hypothetical protein
MASDTTAAPDWKVYRNEEYGFEFEYPGEISNLRSEKNLVLLHSFSSNFLEPTYGLAVEQKAEKQSVEAWMEEIVKKPFGEKTLAQGFLTQREVNRINQSRGPGVGFVQENIKVGEQDAIYQTIGGEGGGGAYIIFVKENKVYIFFAVQDGRLAQETKDLLKKLSLTFKFVNFGDMSGSKVYRNEKFGFEFEYPASWKMQEKDSGAALEPIVKNKPENIFIGAFASTARFEQQNLKTLAEWMAQIPSVKCHRTKVVKDNSWCVVEDWFEGVRNDSYGITQNGVDYIVNLNVGYGRQGMDSYLSDSELQDEIKALNEILSTFKFIQR